MRCKIFGHEWKEDVNNYLIAKCYNPEPVDEIKPGIQYQVEHIYKCSRCGKEKKR